MLIDEKINELQNLIKRKITYEELAPILGVESANAIRNWKYRKRQLKDFEIKKLDEAFIQKTENINKIKQNLSDSADGLKLTVRGNLSLGYGIEINDKEETGNYYISRKLIKDVGANPTYTDLITCEGDSMFPTIESGS